LEPVRAVGSGASGVPLEDCGCMVKGILVTTAKKGDASSRAKQIAISFAPDQVIATPKKTVVLSQ
jgi:hypothetical protein